MHQLLHCASEAAPLFLWPVWVVGVTRQKAIQVIWRAVGFIWARHFSTWTDCCIHGTFLYCYKHICIWRSHSQISVVSEKTLLVYFNSQKPWKIKNFTFYIVLLSHQPNSTANLANPAEFYGACQLSPQKDNVGIQKFFFPWFWLSKLSKIYFFQRPIMPPHFWARIHGV